MKATLLGDIHGYHQIVLRLLSNHASDPNLLQLPIIQIGDFGFKHSYGAVRHCTKKELMILGGNHDEYPVLTTMSSYLGDF